MKNWIRFQMSLKLIDKILDWPQNWLLMKNLQFLTKSIETLSFGHNHGVVKWEKFQLKWSKIVDFSLIANCEASLRFCYQSLCTTFFSEPRGKNFLVNQNSIWWGKCILMVSEIETRCILSKLLTIQTKCSTCCITKSVVQPIR